MTIEVYREGELLGRVPNGQQAIVNVNDGNRERFRLTGISSGGVVEVREVGLAEQRDTTAQIRVLKNGAEWEFKKHQLRAVDSSPSDELYIAE